MMMSFLSAPFNFGRIVGSIGVVSITTAMVGAPSTVEPVSAQAPSEPVVFTKDVAPILQRHCQMCHRPGSIAPMSLRTHEEVRPWARAIKAAVQTRRMPPWTLDRSIGIQRFKEDPSLSDEDIATLVKWVDSGAPQGNPADMPPPRQFDDGRRWTLGEPDWIIPIPEPFVVEATGPNTWVDLWVDTGLTEDRWVKAVETKPSREGYRVVHHASTFMYYNDDPTDDGRGERLGEYAQGKNADIFPEGTGRLMKAGTKIRFNIHYAPNGKQTVDRTAVGVWFYPKGYVPKRKAIHGHFGMVKDLDMPQGDSNIRHDGYTVLKDNLRLTVFQPHLHNRGKRQCLEAIYPNGRVEVLNCVNFDFGWHIAFNYEDDVQPLLPKGTVIHVTSWHDNSAANKWNADPQNWVGNGSRSSDEMAHANVTWYTLSDEEFAEQVKARRAAMAKAAPTQTR